jgi:hypothetical protein
VDDVWRLNAGRLGSVAGPKSGRERFAGTAVTGTPRWLWPLLAPFAVVLVGACTGTPRQLTSKDVQGRWISAPDDIVGWTMNVRVVTFGPDGKVRATTSPDERRLTNTPEALLGEYLMRGDSVLIVYREAGNVAVYRLAGDSLIGLAAPSMPGLPPNTARGRVFLRGQ